MNDPGHDLKGADPSPAAAPPPTVPPLPTQGPVPEVKVDRWAHRRGEPRPLALLWTLFLAFSTTVCLAALAARGATSYEAYRPAARSLFVVVALGLSVLWPMVRLSQSSDRKSVAAWIWKDLIVLLLPAQAVIWPQCFFFLAKWPVSVVGAVAAMLTAWSVLVGAVLAWASSSLARPRADRPPDRPNRAALMLAFLALVGVGPALGTLFRSMRHADLDDFDAWAMASPVTAVGELTRDRLWTGQPAQVVAAHWWTIAAVAAFATLAWAAVGVQSRREPPPRTI